MSDEGFKLQWSVSLPPVAQYAKGHMMNFRADTAEELNALLDEVLAQETVDKAMSVAALFTGAQVVHSPAPAPAAPAAEAAPAAAPVGQVKTCAHGVRTRRTGTNAKTGKAWVGHFCPQPKGAPDQCDPVFGDS